MEDMRAVLMNQHAGLIQPVIGIAADMGTLFEDQHLFTFFRQQSCRDCPGESGADDNGIIIHVGNSFQFSNQKRIQ